MLKQYLRDGINYRIFDVMKLKNIVQVDIDIRHHDENGNEYIVNLHSVNCVKGLLEDLLRSMLRAGTNALYSINELTNDVVLEENYKEYTIQMTFDNSTPV